GTRFRSCALCPTRSESRRHNAKYSVIIAVFNSWDNPIVRWVISLCRLECGANRMATAAFGGIMWHMRQAVSCADGASHSDGELLHRFRADRDEAAFAALVRRHGPM